MERIVVLGGGESGAGSAVLAKVKGFDVFLSDMGAIAPKYKQLLEQYGIPFEEGGHTEELILSADRVVKSPGIPDKAPMVVKLREQVTPVISEIEFAGEFTNARTICITGSNGKTTTTTLIYRILLGAGYNVGLGGNIGESFALSVATHDYDWYVLELSSFQLDGVNNFRADIGVLMNITPDHLDRYDYNLQNYVDSKFRIIRNQRPEDTFIYSGDDPLTIANLGRHDLPMKQRVFSAKKGEAAARYDHGCIEVSSDGTSLSYNMNELKIKGLHNAYNAMAASLAAIAAGVPAENIYSALKSFTGVEHRLETVGFVDGAQYINDSKATNVDSAWYALESMTRPVVWIAGGTDKGNDYSALYELTPKIKALVCMGVDNEKLKEAFKGRIENIVDAHNFEEAMAASRELAGKGDVVLLSPACASFDLFKNYEDRGHRFKEWVVERSAKEHKLGRFLWFIVAFIVVVPSVYALVRIIMGADMSFMELVRPWFSGLPFISMIVIGVLMFFADEVIARFFTRKR